MPAPNDRRPSSQRKQVLPPAAELIIERLGGEGDGIGRLPDGTPAYVPYALPGETLLVQPQAKLGDGWEASIVEIRAASPDRIAPVCRHFGSCGGCVLQQAGEASYVAYKTDLLTAALRRAGCDIIPAPLVRTPPASRRRLDLALLRTGGALRMGLHQRRGQTVVDLRECPVTDPALADLLVPLRAVLSGLNGLKREGSAVLNLLDSGPDFLLRSDAELSTTDRTKLAEFAHRHGLARISWSRHTHAGVIALPEPVAVLRTAELAFSGARMQPPPGTFLQASRAGEAAIIEAMLAGLPDKLPGRAPIIELYAGVGTLTFPLATRARVKAYEGAADAVAALRRAAGGIRIEVFERDLTRQPLQGTELAGAAAVVLDPPFAGAAPQVAQIAASGVKRVVYVSCNPAVLSRDLRSLMLAGYRVLSAVPIDQFLWSPRLEAVVTLEK